MQRTSHHLFSGTRFAQDQYRRVVAGDRGDIAQHRAQRGTLAYQTEAAWRGEVGVKPVPMLGILEQFVHACRGKWLAQISIRWRSDRAAGMLGAGAAGDEDDAARMVPWHAFDNVEAVA